MVTHLLATCLLENYSFDTAFVLLLLYACVQEIYREPSAIPVNAEVEVT